MTNRVVHFEIPADDMARAQRFSRDAFGWAIDARPNFQYALLGTTPSDDPLGRARTGLTRLRKLRKLPA